MQKIVLLCFFFIKKKKKTKLTVLPFAIEIRHVKHWKVKKDEGFCRTTIGKFFMGKKHWKKREATIRQVGKYLGKSCRQKCKKKPFLRNRTMLIVALPKKKILLVSRNGKVFLRLSFFFFFFTGFSHKIMEMPVCAPHRHFPPLIFFFFLHAPSSCKTVVVVVGGRLVYTSGVLNSL